MTTTLMILKSIITCKIKKNDCVYVSGNLFNLGRCRIKILKNPELFFKAILEVIGNNGTIIVPTHFI